MAIDKVAALRATVLFGSLTNEELHALASLCTEHKLSREEVLFIAGEEQAVEIEHAVNSR